MGQAKVRKQLMGDRYGKPTGFASSEPDTQPFQVVIVDNSISKEDSYPSVKCPTGHTLVFSKTISLCDKLLQSEIKKCAGIKIPNNCHVFSFTISELGMFGLFFTKRDYSRCVMLGEGNITPDKSLSDFFSSSKSTTFLIKVSEALYSSGVVSLVS